MKYACFRIERLEVQVSIYDSFVPGIRRLWVVHGNQGNQWKYAQVDVDVNDRLENVKVQVCLAFSNC